MTVEVSREHRRIVERKLASRRDELQGLYERLVQRADRVERKQKKAIKLVGKLAAKAVRGRHDGNLRSFQEVFRHAKKVSVTAKEEGQVAERVRLCAGKLKVQLSICDEQLTELRRVSSADKDERALIAAETECEQLDELAVLRRVAQFEREQEPVTLLEQDSQSDSSPDANGYQELQSADPGSREMSDEGGVPQELESFQHILESAEKEPPSSYSFAYEVEDGSAVTVRILRCEEKHLSIEVELESSMTSPRVLSLLKRRLGETLQASGFVLHAITFTVTGGKP